MKLFEYQAKDVFSRYNITVPQGMTVENLEQLKDALNKVGYPCVLKSQVLRGGRGKAGLIQFVKNQSEALDKAKALFESTHGVKKILVEQAVNIDKEIYISVTVDPVDAKALIMACTDGGVDIETIAATTPEKIIKEKVDINIGLMPFQINDFVYRLGLTGDIAKKASRIVASLYNIFEKYDAELVEINPLFITSEGDVVAGDGKLIIDDNSMFRQKEFEKTREYFDNEMEYEAAREGIPYLQFGGDISLMCAGAGLANTVYDLINYAGGTVANYLEFGGPNYMKSQIAMDICLKNKSKVILIVTFGTIARADVMAQGISDAIKNLKPDRPIVVCIRGTGEEKAVEILKEAGLDCLFDTEEAVLKAVSIASGEVF